MARVNFIAWKDRPGIIWKDRLAIVWYPSTIVASEEVIMVVTSKDPFPVGITVAPLPYADITSKLPIIINLDALDPIGMGVTSKEPIDVDIDT